MKQVGLLVILLLCWLIFSGFEQRFFLVSGVFCSLITLGLAQRMKLLGHEDILPGSMHLVPFHFLRLLKEMFLSGLWVTGRILSKTPRISPRFGWVESPRLNLAEHTLYANSITLTPGTVSVNIELTDNQKTHILVHSLDKRWLETLQKESRRMKLQPSVDKS